MNTKTNIVAIKEVQMATEEAMQAVILYIKTAKEPISEVCHEIIDETLAKYDCESPENHIVAGGVQSAEPHEEGAGKLEGGLPIVIDIYPRSKSSGYFADMTRTICVGEPPKELQTMYDTVLSAQNLALSMVGPGVKCIEIQQAVENKFLESGYKTSGKGKEFPFKEGFVHSLGHGVGQEIHQSPYIGRKSKDIVEEGDVVTIEPGLYYKNMGGVRLEDMVLITSSGAENLTNYPKRLQI